MDPKGCLLLWNEFCCEHPCRPSSAARSRCAAACAHALAGLVSAYLRRVLSVFEPTQDLEGLGGNGPSRASEEPATPVPEPFSRRRPQMEAHGVLIGGAEQPDGSTPMLLAGSRHAARPTTRYAVRGVGRDMATAEQVEWIVTPSSAGSAFGLRRPAVRAGASSPEPVRHDERHPAAAVPAGVLGPGRAPAFSGALVDAGAGPTLWRAGSPEGRCATDRAPAGEAIDGRRRGVQRSRLPRESLVQFARPPPPNRGTPTSPPHSGWAAVRAREVLPAPDTVRGGIPGLVQQPAPPLSRMRHSGADRRHAPRGRPASANLFG